MALQILEDWPSGSGAVGRDNADEYSAIVWGDPNPNTDNADNPRVATLFAMQHFVLTSEMDNVFTTLSRERLAPGFWRFVAKYVSSTENRQTGDASFTYSVGGGTQHITHAKATVGTYVPASSTSGTSTTTSSTTAPDFMGAINVTENGVDGVDVGAKTSAFEVTFYIAPNNMTAQYDQLVENLQETVNSDTVVLNVDGILRTYQPGELLYDQGTGSKRKGQGDWEINLKCKVSKNATNITIGTSTSSSTTTTSTTTTSSSSGPIIVPSKRGWDYLWVKYAPQVHSGSQTLIMAPIAATVVETYDYGPLSPLFAPSGFGEPGSQGGLSWQNPTNGSGGSGTGGS